MPGDDEDIRFVYRFTPRNEIIGWSILFGVIAGYGVFKWLTESFGGGSAFLLLISLFPLSRILFLPQVSFVVTGESLLVVRRRLIRLFGRSDVYARADMRRLRYHSELHHDSEGSDYRIYYLTLITVDGRVIQLLRAREAVPLALRHQLADALEVEYEEIGVS